METDEIKNILEDHGATFYSMPMIEISALDFSLPKALEAYDWLVFTSKNAVNSFFGKYENVSNKIAVIGASTAFSLSQFNIKADFTGQGKSAKDFAEEFFPQLNENENILLLPGNLAPDHVQNKLALKANVDRVNVYQTKATENSSQEVLTMIQNDKYDALLVTSPSAYQNLCIKLKTAQPKLRLISIGSTTTEAIHKNNDTPLATAEDSSYAGLAYCTIHYFKNKQKN